MEDRTGFNSQPFNGDNNGYQYGNVNPYSIRNGQDDPSRRGFQNPNPQQYNPRTYQQNPGYRPINPTYPNQNRGINQPIGQQIPPQYIQNPNQVSNQDVEDSFEYIPPQQMPMQGNPIMPNYSQQMQPRPQQPVQQPKKKGIFGGLFSKKEEAQPQPQRVANRYVNVVAPMNTDDARSVVDMVVNGDTVIIDFSKLDERNGNRVLDFISGASYAIDGMLTFMEDRKFIFTPKGVAVNNVNKGKK